MKDETYIGYGIDLRQFRLKLSDLLSERQQQFSYSLLPDAWGTPILEELTALAPAEREPWLRVLNWCASAKKSVPSNNWLEEARSLIEEAGSENYTHTLQRWISFFSAKKSGYIDGGNSDILRGLIWSCSGNSDRALASTLADAAIEGYRKQPGLGPRCPKVGGAAVTTLTTMQGRDAIGQLERVRRNVKQPSYQEKIGQALDRVARREKMSRSDLEELMLPTFDLQDGQVQRTIGTWKAQLTAGGRKVTQQWLDPEGKIHSDLPAAVKRACKEEIKELKRLIDDIERMVNDQRERLERLFLSERSWSLEDWRERYLEHPLLSTLVRRLIWQIRSGEQNWRVIWHEGRLVDATGHPLTLPDQSEVVLWHPIMSGAQEVRRWCLWLEEQRIVQPFKQAHREIYPLTTAEQVTSHYSQRFAGHFMQSYNQRSLSLQAEGRKQILERLLPRLEIAERCILEERFLLVRGNLCSYRIHLGSGNIFIEPEPQYLCIVFDAKTRATEEEKFFLPFEGDPLLALILSKAFLLAEDEQIKDPSIVSQILRSET